MTCVLLKLSMDCIWTYVDYMYGGLWSYMLMLTCIMSLILVKEMSLSKVILGKHLSVLEEVVWAVTSCLTQVCLKVILGRGPTVMK